MSINPISAIAKIAFVAIGLFVGFVATEYSFNKYNKKFFNPEFITAADRERQLKCLTLNIYHEAGIEHFEGKVAVAQVTLNRVASGQFPTDICQVVYQKTSFMSKTVCQFSWHCLQPARLAPLNTKSYEESYIVAKKVLLENFRLDMLENALYYHADYVNPGWKYKRIGKIGRHIFYE